MTHRKKLIEVALPLEAINEASAREKSIRHGHPSTLHLWWARRPLAAARAVIFASLVDDPGHHPEDQTEPLSAPPEFIAACRKLPKGKNAEGVDEKGRSNDTPRMRLFDFIERLVLWESTTDERVLTTARELIRLSTGGNPPPLLDPFAGGGSIPLEAQRLGLEAHASDLNPVAVMINKALIEIPPRFANQSPVNPRDRATLTPSPSPKMGEGGHWKGAAGLAADVRYYGEWMRDRAFERIGHLYPKYHPHPPTPSPIEGEGESSPPSELGEGLGEGANTDRWEISPALERKMRDVARELRKSPTPSEAVLWQAIRKRQVEGRKFRRQMPIGPFVVDFYCSSERLAVEVDGPIHETQREADQTRQTLIESLGIRFVRITAEQVEQNLPQVLNSIRAAFLPHPPAPSPNTREGDLRQNHPHPPTPSPSTREGELRQKLPSPLVGEGLGKGGNPETVIAWLWARTVRCPNPACGAMMPLVRSFELSKKKGRRAWVVPHIDPHSRKITFEVKSGKGTPPDGTVNRQGATCLACGNAVPFDHIRDEGKAGRMSAQLMAIVTEGSSGRSYYAPTPEHEHVADVPIPDDAPLTDLPEQALGFRVQLYGMTQHRDLFTPRQLTALTTFSDLVAEARRQIEADARAAGLDSSPILGEAGRGPDSTPLRDGGRGATAYAEAVSVYLGMAVSKLADYNSSLAVWSPNRDQAKATFARQALPMVWDYTEVNMFAEAAGDLAVTLTGISRTIENNLNAIGVGSANQVDATKITGVKEICISTDPPYYDNIGYADLSDYSYTWLRKNLRVVYPDIFGTVLVPKEPELVATPYRFNGDKAAAEKHFEDGLNQTFHHLRQITSPDFPLTVYYAFKQQEIAVEEGTASTGWETMLTGLIETGFQIAGTWPMRTERGGRMVSVGTNALASSIVLVCRPRPADAPLTSRREFVNALRRELPAALREMQSGNIAPVDLAQASIGPGMAVYSRYSKVLEPDGSRLTVRAALQLINHELDAYLAEQEGALDADSRFAVAWFEQFGFKEGGFGQADVLARAKNTSVDGLRNAGVLEAGAGKVRLIPWEELDAAWDPASDRRLTVWEATHHLIERLNHHGEAGAAMLLAKMPPDLAAEARQLAYRLYSICERKSWADHARDYNALVISWSASQEQAVKVREQYRQSSFFNE